MSIVDPSDSLTGSDDPSYITREYYIHDREANSSGSFETVVLKVLSAGITFSNYESTVRRDTLTDSTGLNGISFLQSYDSTSNIVTNSSGSPSDDQWSIQVDGTEYTDSKV